MRGDRDDTNPPLFPGLLRINDTDDGDKANKMPLFHSETTSTSTAPAGFCSFGSSSSTNVGSSTKRKVRPIFATMNECPHSADWYYPPPTTTSPRDEHTCEFLQPRKTLSYRNLLQNNQTVGDRKNSWGDEMSSLTSSIHHVGGGVAPVKKEEFADTALNLTTDEVVRVIGSKLFLHARKTMIHQQKMFSWQMFELHRLITVQRLLARSPEILHPIKPKFPPINKLLYVSPLDTTSSSPKTKIDAQKSDPEKGHVAQPLPSWCFPGNQWLIPVRSPSEGLVYKPYPGPCFPTVGVMNPASYGLGTSYGVAPPNEHGNGGGCYNAEIGQSYFPPYPMPLINSSSSCAINEVKADEVDKSSFKLVSDSHKQKESEWLARDELSLFPTTPSSVDALKEQRNEHKVQVIKVIPHSRDSTPASTARILQSLQEGRRRRKKHD